MKIQILTLLSVLMKICQMPHVIFQTTSQFFLQILQESSVSWNVTPLYFFKSNVVYFEQKAQSKCKFFRLSSALIKIHQILVLFETKIIFSSNFAPPFGIMRHISSIAFLAETLYTFSKSILSKYKFGEISPEQSRI